MNKQSASDYKKDLLKRIGHILKNYRIYYAYLTQDDFEDVSRSTISKIETGQPVHFNSILDYLEEMGLELVDIIEDLQD